MQGGSVQRNGDGWRGLYYEAGKRRSTKTRPTKGEARRLLNQELARIDAGYGWIPPITLAELADRWLAQYDRAPKTMKCARGRLVRPLDAFGDAMAGDITPEALQAWLARLPREKVGAAYRRDLVRTLRAVYAFGVEARLVQSNPAQRVKAPKPVRGENIVPFESWAEVERVAQECGRWAPLVLFMADSGARPAEAVALEHRHLDGNVCELPGTKTEAAWRTVHLTHRGVEAVQSVPRSITTRRVFHVDGRPISFTYFRREVWHPALNLAGLEPRAPYCLRHTFAYRSLRAGVPIATVAREMRHASVERTFQVYGGWCREMGADAAAMRETWADGTRAELIPTEARSQSG